MGRARAVDLEQSCGLALAVECSLTQTTEVQKNSGRFNHFPDAILVPWGLSWPAPGRVREP